MTLSAARHYAFGRLSFYHEAARKYAFQLKVKTGRLLVEAVFVGSLTITKSGC